MWRSWLGIFILVGFLVFGFWISCSMDQIHLTVSGQLEDAAQLALSQQPEDAYRLAMDAKALWEKNWNGSACVADHGPMDEIDGLFSQLEGYYRAAQPGDFAVCCSRLSMLVEAMSEAHSITWWNLL